MIVMRVKHGKKHVKFYGKTYGKTWSMAKSMVIFKGFSTHKWPCGCFVSGTVVVWKFVQMENQNISNLQPPAGH